MLRLRWLLEVEKGKTMLLVSASVVVVVVVVVVVKVVTSTTGTAFILIKLISNNILVVTVIAMGKKLNEASKDSQIFSSTLHQMDLPCKLNAIFALIHITLF